MDKALNELKQEVKATDSVSNKVSEADVKSRYSIRSRHSRALKSQAVGRANYLDGGFNKTQKVESTGNG